MKLLLNTSFHKTTSTGAKNELKAYDLNAVIKWQNHNHRVYKNNEFSTSKIDFKLSYLNKYITLGDNYKKWFNNQVPQSFIDEYNKGKKPSRQIDNYFDFMTKKGKSNKQAIAEQIIVQFGSENELQDIYNLCKTDAKWANYWYDYQWEFKEHLNKILPDFKVYDVSLHLDETSPHLHIIGAGFKHTPNLKQGMKFRLASSSIFTRETLKDLHVQFREFNINQASKLQHLLQDLNIYSHKGEIKQVKKYKPFKHSKIQIEANQKNIADLKNIKTKEVENVISKIPVLPKKDKLILLDELNSNLDQRYKLDALKINQELQEQVINKLNTQTKWDTKQLKQATEDYKKELIDVFRKQYQELEQNYHKQLLQHQEDFSLRFDALQRENEKLNSNNHKLRDQVRQSKYHISSLESNLEALEIKNERITKTLNEANKYISKYHQDEIEDYAFYTSQDENKIKVKSKSLTL